MLKSLKSLIFRQCESLQIVFNNFNYFAHAVQAIIEVDEPFYVLEMSDPADYFSSIYYSYSYLNLFFFSVYNLSFSIS